MDKPFQGHEPSEKGKRRSGAEGLSISFAAARVFLMEGKIPTGSSITLARPPSSPFSRMGR